LRECIDERYAILVDNKDLKAWIQAVEKLYSDIEFRENIAKNAYKYCV
jgi:glycosyltransferase involved in cell wall biosynthesis